MRIYATYPDLGEALLTYSALRAGGFEPTLPNIHHAQLNHFKALALGGYMICLGDDDIAAAREWQDWLHTQALPADTMESYQPLRNLSAAVLLTGPYVFGLITVLSIWGIFRQLWLRDSAKGTV